MGILNNAQAFFNSARDTKLFGPMTMTQVNGCNAILAAIGKAGWPVAWGAYGIATAYHETARTMLPVRERGNGDGPDPDHWDDYLQKYDTGQLALALGNTPEADGDGVLYAGRGYVQLTGRRNYQRASDELGQDFISTPDLAMQPALAAAIMVRGMAAGWFTGKRLVDFLPPGAAGNKPAFYLARRIINGSDRADVIADYAMRFQTALVAGEWA